MKHLGILAHSAEGASLCFREFCHGADGRADMHPDVSLDCIAFGRTMPAWNSGDHAAVKEVLAVSVERLAAAGADFFVCPDNTAHLALESPGPALPLPGLHIADAVADRAARQGHRKVGVLGTAFTMEGPVYPRALKAKGIDAGIPDSDDRAFVHEAVFSELVHGVFKDSTRTAFGEIVARLARDGCDAVALVCTEIPILLPPEASPLPVLDSTRLLARAAREVADEGRPMPVWRGGPV
ncbi:aspartate/glutamate racemase family protein [Nocardiopsis baichengensis]|uniref:aspartate/glutamate racemase family protein n=1 Tax=Nocardiopsis baichengensis TaxID=280240 RepID=UPI00034AF3C5|nr:amino acid racemase [Nocardiopsis baichengensis]